MAPGTRPSDIPPMKTELYNAIITQAETLSELKKELELTNKAVNEYEAHDTEARLDQVKQSEQFGHLKSLYALRADIKAVQAMITETASAIEQWGLSPLRDAEDKTGLRQFDVLDRNDGAANDVGEAIKDLLKPENDGGS